MPFRISISLEEQTSRAKRATLLFSLGIIGAVMFATLHDDSVRVLIKVLGERPLGLPIRVLLAAFVLVMSLPIPFAAWHAFRVLLRGYSDPDHFGGLGLISLLTIPQKHPDLKRSRAIVVVTMVGYVALMIAWIIFAAARGI